jgi:hypothetical protein
VWLRVREAVGALPLYFRSETALSGLSATDLFTLNTALGATIEDNVVRTLNEMRSLWDPDAEYRLYGFARQPQTFPDVVLRKHGAHPGPDSIVLGIELKGWYLLAKEEEPSFRFRVTPAVCALQDLLTVVPWALSDVIAGRPQVFEPFVISARHAAQYRNYHWRALKRARGDSRIQSPEGMSPYPSKSDQIADVPASDAGGNFGRIARTGIMDEYLEQLGRVELRGIEVRHWRSFFKAFGESRDESSIDRSLERIRARVRSAPAQGQDPTLASVRAIVEELESIIS